MTGVDISKEEEYEVVSIALGKRTQRVFMHGGTGGLMLTLRDAVRAPETGTECVRGFLTAKGGQNGGLF